MFKARYAGSADFRAEDYKGVRTCVIKSKVCQYQTLSRSSRIRCLLQVVHENATPRISKTAALLSSLYPTAISIKHRFSQLQSISGD